MPASSKKFYSSLGLLLFLNGVIKPIWIFGIDRRVQNEVGTEIYGVYFSLLSLSIVFSFLLDWGLTAFLNRQLAAGQKFYQENIGNLLLLKLFFAAVYIIAVIITAAIAGISHWHLLVARIIDTGTYIAVYFFTRHSNGSPKFFCRCLALRT